MPGDPLVLVNVWDVASARTVAGAPGCRAIATASWAIAAAHGYADGQRIPFELMLAAVERIAAAVEQPVTADLESGYGETRAQVAETVARAIAPVRWARTSRTACAPVAEHAAVVKAVRERAEREGVPFVINARSDEYLLGERRLDAGDRERARLSRRRGRLHLRAGHPRARRDRAPRDGARRPGERARRARRAAAAELAAAGVAESASGQAPLGVASAALAAAAERLLARGDYPPELGHRPPAG